MQIQNAVPAYFTSKQILTFGFAEQEASSHFFASRPDRDRESGSFLNNLSVTKLCYNPETQCERLPNIEPALGTCIVLSSMGSALNRPIT